MFYLSKNKLISCFDNIGVFSKIYSGSVELVKIVVFHSDVGKIVPT